jgi:pimeloyl-ACP methyl ester carboxylesterase
VCRGKIEGIGHFPSAEAPAAIADQILLATLLS